MKPKPIYYKDGVPWCSSKCPLLAAGEYQTYSCDLLKEDLPDGVDNICEPTVRAMVLELRNLRDSATPSSPRPK